MRSSLARHLARPNRNGGCKHVPLYAPLYRPLMPRSGSGSCRHNDVWRVDGLGTFRELAESLTGRASPITVAS
jgi:hypothetical protein